MWIAFSHKVKLTILGILLLCVVLLFATFGPTVYGMVTINSSLTVRAKSVDEEITFLQTFGENSSTVTQLKTKQQVIGEQQKQHPFSEEVLTSYNDFLNEIASTKEQLLSDLYQKLTDKVVENQAKLDQIREFGSEVSIKEDELQSIESKVASAQTKEDFDVAERLLDQMDFFLQNVINTKKTMYLQEHLAKQVEDIKTLLAEGKRIGVKDQELEDAVNVITTSQSNAKYLFQLEQYESILIDKKIAYAQAVEKKKEELKQQASSYIAIKSPSKYFDGKYIEVSIPEQVVRLYENGEQIQSDFIVSGKNGFETTSGLHKVWSKRKSFRMQGNLRGQEWDVWTNYATFFTYSGEALHDSPWRRVFGPKAGRAWNGSHGCINMKKDIAKFVYEWADIGTPVYVNYE